MSVNRYVMPIVVVGVLLGTVFGSQVAGWWSISGRSSVNLDQFSPVDIKGWMTLLQVADGLKIPLDEVYRAGGIPAEVPPETPLKDMEDVVEVSTLRDVLAAYLSGADSTGPVEEPTPEADAAPAATPVPAAPAGSDSVLHAGDGTGPTPLPPGEVLSADQIKGRMTLREVSEQCAVDPDALLVALKLAPGTDLDTQLKTLISDGTLDEVTQVQEAVAALQG